MQSSPVDRRTFLQSLGGTLAAASLAGRPLYGASPSVAPARSSNGGVPITFLEPAEVLICGSTLFACQLALESARRGQRTTLVMDRVNPFFEGIACLRSWIPTDEAARFPEVVRAVLTPPTAEEKNGRLYFNASKAALEIEDQLTQAGVRFLYNASLAGGLGCGGRLAGAVFGGKTGLFAIESRVIVDATLEATLARAAGAKFTPVQGPRRCHYVVDLASPVAPRSLQYTASNGLSVRADVHHYFASFDVSFESAPSGPLTFAEDFDKIYAASLEMPWAGSEKRFRGADGFLSSGVDRLDALNGSVPGFENLFVFGPHG
ncbi:MAG: FAD-dependent oxidoreductase, partial [Verrucomicrobia bacterium]|nr:FAD-dependent oxidoreductase [Verrucomicrobiota bacterium]